MADGLSAALTEASPMRSTQMAACGAKKDAADQHLKRVQLQAADLWKKVTDDGPCLLLSNGGRFGCPPPPLPHLVARRARSCPEAADSVGS